MSYLYRFVGKGEIRKLSMFQIVVGKCWAVGGTHCEPIGTIVTTPDVVNSCGATGGAQSSPQLINTGVYVRA